MQCRLEPKYNVSCCRIDNLGSFETQFQLPFLAMYITLEKLGYKLLSMHITEGYHIELLCRTMPLHLSTHLFFGLISPCKSV